MKEGSIEKSAGAADPEAMKLIGEYTRRELKPEEVYIFSLILCDNEIDRDWERFSTGALEELGKLFVGKTGIFDHNPTGENQTARIYRCKAVRDEARKNSVGEPYCYLRGEAYMVRSPKTQQLILELDAGIKKEVSVGCAMGKALCSICGSDRKTAPCQHRPGEIYQGVQCHTVLSQAVDAYEWSFVAIPAQRRAGVVKNHRLGELIAPDEVVKALGWGEEITLSPATAKGLAARIQELEALAQGGREYRENLTKEAVRLGLLGEQGLTKELLEKSLQGLSTAELAAWERHYRQKAAKVLPLLQTQGRSERGDTRELLNEEFKV